LTFFCFKKTICYLQPASLYFKEHFLLFLLSISEVKKFFSRFSEPIRTFYRRKTDFYEKKTIR
jgi:hypothetical protein